MAEPTATDAPTISTEDNDSAADAFVRAIAIERGVRQDDESTNKVMTFNFDPDSDISLVGSPEDQDRFMRVLRRSMMVDPALEEMIHVAQAAGIPMDINVGRGQSGLFVGSAGSTVSTTTGRGTLLPGGAVADPSDTVGPLGQTIDLDDIEALPRMMRTNAQGSHFNQEAVMGHEVRELIATSLLTNQQILNTPAGAKLFESAHADATAAESDLRRLISGRTVGVSRRTHHTEQSGPHADSPDGTTRRIELTFSDGSKTEIDMNDTNMILGVRDTFRPRRVPTRQGSN